MERRKAVPLAAALALGSMVMAAAANFGLLTQDDPASVTRTLIESAATTEPVTTPAAPQVEVRYEDIIVPVPATAAAAAAGSVESPPATGESSVTVTTFDDHGGDDDDHEDDDDDDGGRGRGRGGDD